MQIGLDLIELKDICILCNFFSRVNHTIAIQSAADVFLFWMENSWETHFIHHNSIPLFFSLWFFYCFSKECGCLLSLFVPFFHQSHCNLLFTAKFDTRKYHIFMSHFTYFLPSILFTFVTYFRASTTKLHSCEELLLSFCIILTIFHDFFSQPIQMTPIIWNTNADVIMRFFSLCCDIQACWQRKLVIISNYQVCWFNTVTTAV